MKDISIIIVNYNVKELLENCINSIFDASDGLDTEIIVVDNNSFDGSPEYLSQKFANNKNVKFIFNKENLGFAKANNIGVKNSTGKYLLILNPDTLLQEDTLIKSIQFYESIEDIGALTCKLILPNGKLDLACRRSFPSPSVALPRILGLSKLFPKIKLFGKYNLTYLDENQTYEIDALCGAFILVRRVIYDQIGGFDEDYFMYGEDLDLCYKIKKAGYTIYYYAGTSTIHYKGESTKKSSISYVQNFYGAMKIFVEKNLNTKSQLLNLVIRLSIVYRAVFSYIKRIALYIFPIIIDLILIVIAMLISIQLRFEKLPLEAYTIVIIIYGLIWILTLAVAGSYKQNERYNIIKAFNGILFGFFINSSFTYFFNEFAYSRVVVLRTTAYAFILLALWRIIAKLYIYIKHRNVFYKENNTIVIGKTNESENFITKLNKSIDSGYNFIGYISTNDEQTDKDVIGNLNNLNDVISAYKIKNLIFVKSVLSIQQILDIMWRLRNYNIEYKIITGENDILLGKSEIDRIDDIYLMEIEYNINKKLNIFVKRVFDVFLGILTLIFIYPIVFIWSKLRKSTIDEDKFFKKILLIPEVIKGNLSLVGRAVWDRSSLGKNFLGKNGLTGLAQLNYYKNLTQEDIEYYNSYYAKNQTLLLDLEILFKTFTLYFFRKKLIKL